MAEGEIMRLPPPAQAACLLMTLALAGCGPTIIVADTKPLEQATAEERRTEIGWAVVTCVIQADRSFGDCRVMEASPNTPEVRAAALQGMQMHGNADLPPEALPGGRVRRRLHVGVQ